MVPKAQAGRRSLKNGHDKYHLHGFILVRIDKDSPEEAWIDVVCSMENSKTGQLLVELAEERCRSIASVTTIKLYSLYERKLKM